MISHAECPRYSFALLTACIFPLFTGCGCSNEHERLKRPASVEEDATKIEVDSSGYDISPHVNDGLEIQAQPKSVADSIEALLGFGIQTIQTMSKVGNEMLDQLAGLSVEEENTIGEQAFKETVSRHAVIFDNAQQSRIERLAEPFLKSRSRKHINYKFTIIDDDAVNAFAHLGGFVYVNRGLLDAVQNDDELSFVIGHEIAHIDRRHCVENMTAVIRVQEITGDVGAGIALIAYQALSAGYSEEYEFDSDQWSYRQMRDRGRSHEQSIAGLKMLKRLFGADGDHHAHGPAIIEHVQDHFQTHPRIGDRIDRVEELKDEG